MAVPPVLTTNPFTGGARVPRKNRERRAPHGGQRGWRQVVRNGEREVRAAAALPQSHQ